MKILILITILFFAVVLFAASNNNSQITKTPLPTGTATPKAVDPTQKLDCDFYYANWGRSTWPGTKDKPWNFHYQKRGLRGKWVCNVNNNLTQVNGAKP